MGPVPRNILGDQGFGQQSCCDARGNRCAATLQKALSCITVLQPPNRRPAP